MTQMMVSFGGAAIGSMFGQPQLGWMAGTALGSFLFPSEQAKNAGRLDDLKVSASSYGKGIAIAYGRMRCSGNMIWATDFEEKVGGKKGKNPKAKKGVPDIYSYFANFAMALCEGPANRILRVWADGKEIWRDASVVVPDEYESDDDWVIEQKEKGWPMRRYMRFYYGNESQNPDPMMVQKLGADQCPAYRGLCYIVFERLPLEEFGNRTPTINVEVERLLEGTDTRPVRIYTQRALPGELQEYMEDLGNASKIEAAQRSWVRTSTRVLHMATTVDNANAPFGRETVIRRISIDTQQELDPFRESIWTRGWSVMLPGGDPENPRFIRETKIIGGLASGEIIVSFQSNHTAHGRYIGYLEPNTGAIRKILDLGSNSNTGLDAQYRLYGLDTLSTRHFMALAPRIKDVFSPGYVGGSLFADNTVQIGFLGEWGMPALDIVFDESLGRTLDFVIGCGCAVPTPGDAHFVAIASERGSGGKLAFRRIRPDFGTLDGRPNLDPWVDVDLGLTNLAVDSAVNVAADYIVVWGTSDAGSHVFVFSADDYSLIWQQTYMDFQEWVFLQSEPVLGSEVIWVSSADYVRRVDVLELVQSAHAGTDQGQNSTDTKQFYLEGGRMCVHYRGHLQNGTSMVPAYGYMSVTGTTGVEGNLDEILLDVSKQVGVEPEDVVFAGLEGETIDGYLIEQPREAGTIVSELQKAYMFDVAEVDGKVHFRSRNREAVRTIQEKDFALLTEEFDDRAEYREVRTKIFDAPSRVNVSYINPQRDFHVGTEASQRNTGPHRTVPVSSTMEMNFPIALTPRRAKEMSYTILKSIWTERTTWEYRLPWTHMDLDPTDVVDLQLNDGSLHRSRLLKSDLGADLTMDVAGINHEAGTWTDIPPDFEVVLPPKVVNPNDRLVEPVPLVLDIPLLNDLHDPGDDRMLVYGFAGTERIGDYKAVMVKSWNGGPQQAAGRPTTVAEWGFVEMVVPAPPNGTWATDTSTRIRLRPTITEPEEWSSADDDNAFRAGQNAILIGEELIYFRDVDILEDGAIEISHLLRGRRGTEWAIGDHQYGDRFVVVSAGSALPVTIVDALEFLGASMLVSLLYQTSEGSGERAVRIKARANSRRPWAPVHIKSETVDGEAHLTWTRRSRLSSPLRDWTGDVPLEEAEEKYEVFLLKPDQEFDPDLAATYHVRFESTTPSFVIPADVLQTAGIAPRGAFGVAVIQFSGKVGRGFPGTATLEL